MSAPILPPAAPPRSHARCHSCEVVLGLPEAHEEASLRCPRCGATVHRRIPGSLSQCWAFVLGALACYLPANALPVMETSTLTAYQDDTILSGVFFLLHHGLWPLAIIVFTASVAVPLLKIAALIFLLVSVQLRSTWRPRERTQIYRITEAVGRWSMVDIFVVTILVALVRLDTLATVMPGMGAIFFGAVVVLTMIAAERFDPRLIWDGVDEAEAAGSGAPRALRAES